MVKTIVLSEKITRTKEIGFCPTGGSTYRSDGGVATPHFSVNEKVPSKLWAKICSVSKGYTT